MPGSHGCRDGGRDVRHNKAKRGVEGNSSSAMRQRRARASSSDLGAENTSVQASVAATPTSTQVLAKVKASEKFKVTVDVSCIEEG